MIRKFLCAVFVFCHIFLVGQHQADIWYFGEGVGMDFSGGEPVGFDGGEVYGNPQQIGDYQYSEGVAVISDDEGDLLFYSNGEKVWNSNHEVMPNGSDLMGMYSSTHPAFIVPQPNTDSLFYLFTTDGLERSLANGLRYSKVSMCRDGGMGDVISEKKNVFLLDTVAEKLATTYHSNGTDIWLVTHKFFSDAFYAYLITESGITDTVVSHVGSVHVGNLSYLNGCGGAIGQMKISPNGSRLALVFSNVNPPKAELFNFDSTTGIVSNYIGLQPYSELSSFSFVYGVEFSPDNSKLYINGLSGLLQFDLTSGDDSISINGTKQHIPMSYSCSSGFLQLAPNNKIYVGRCSTTVSVINEPNFTGLDCNVEEHAVTFGNNQPRGNFPSFIAGLNYHNRKPECLISTHITEKETVSMRVFPNPSSHWITVALDSGVNDWYNLQISDLSGRIVFEQSNIFTSSMEIDVSGFSNGAYMVTVVHPDARVWSELFVVQ